MLKIIFGEIENAVYHPPTYFDHQYEDAWITDPLSIAMIREIDRSEVVSAHLIESPVLGAISPKEISGGVKTLMLMAFDDSGKVFNASLYSFAGVITVRSGFSAAVGRSVRPNR